MADAAVPGFTASPELEAKLNALDDHLEPIKEELQEKDESKDVKEETSEENETVEETEEGEEGSESKEAESDNEESSDEKADEDEGYTIDDGDDSEDDEVVVSESKTEVETVNRADLTPEQNYILNNLAPLTVKGRIGEGELQEFTVYAPEQLPVGFNYEDQREMSIANKTFALMEQKAIELQNEFRTQETQKSAQQFKELEDNADRADINKLQLEGELPKFKTAPDSKDFEKDPATVEIQSILDYKEELNKRYLDEYNAGRPYKHVGFEEAYYMYRRQNPKVDPKVQAEDNAREGIARRTSNTKGRAIDNKPRVSRGMSSRDLDLYLENLDI